jgi:hypothetical protein
MGDDGLNGVVTQALALRVVVIVSSTKSNGTTDSVTRIIVIGLFNIPPSGSRETANESVDNGLLSSTPGTIEDRVN